MRLRALIAAAMVLLASVLAPVPAGAGFGGALANGGNRLTAATLQPPGTPRSGHPSGTGGTVQLSWAASGSSFVTGYQLWRATAPTGPFSTMVCAGVGTSCTDAGAAYNAQYYYRAEATYRNWTAWSATAMALSLPPTGCFENTGGGAVNCATAALAVGGDGATYQTARTWPKNGKPLGSEWLDCDFSPATAGTAVTSVVVTLTYRTTAISGANNANESFQVEVYDGSAWLAFALVGANKATVAGQNVTARLDVSGAIDTPAKVAALRVRFEAATSGATNFSTIHDLVHVDVN